MKVNDMTDKISKYKNKLEKLAIERGFKTCNPTYSFNGTFHSFRFKLDHPMGGSNSSGSSAKESIKEAYERTRDCLLKYGTSREMHMRSLSIDIRNTVAEAKALGISEKKLAKMIAKEWIKKDGDQ